MLLNWGIYHKMSPFSQVQPMQDGLVYNFSGHTITTHGGYFIASLSSGHKFGALDDAMRCIEIEKAILDDVDKLMDTVFV